ncbi:MAG TPA: bL35 family ribosomal protein [Patescibacteria group bacterium]|nr:bL35 family ribosomal protein [Patescibacteria group bacterium]
MKQKKKVKKSVARRFKVTKTGKVIFAHQYHGHLMSKKSKSRIRRQNIPGVLDAAFAKKVKKLLGVA